MTDHEGTEGDDEVTPEAPLSVATLERILQAAQVGLHDAGCWAALAMTRLQPAPQTVSMLDFCAVIYTLWFAVRWDRSTSGGVT